MKSTKEIYGYGKKYKEIIKNQEYELLHQKKELSAKKEFENLEYEYNDDDGFICYKKNITKLIEPNYISFNKLEKEIFMSRPSEESSGLDINMELLQAINKQVEELGWDND